VDVLFVVCKNQADQAGVTDEQFGMAMGGDAIDLATKAFLEELTSFTPSPRDRARAQKVIDATWRMIDKVQDMLDAKAERDLPAAIQAVTSALGSLSTSSPDSSEPTPAP
jgi:ribosome biogenesis protein Tsr3